MSGGYHLQVHGVEDGVATVEAADGRLFDLPAWMLPAGVRAGDRLRARIVEADGEAVRLEMARDREATGASRSEATARLRRLTGADDGGDLDL